MQCPGSSISCGWWRAQPPRHAAAATQAAPCAAALAGRTELMVWHLAVLRRPWGPHIVATWRVDLANGSGGYGDPSNLKSRRARWNSRRLPRGARREAYTTPSSSRPHPRPGGHSIPALDRAHRSSYQQDGALRRVAPRRAVRAAMERCCALLLLGLLMGAARSEEVDNELCLQGAYQVVLGMPDVSLWGEVPRSRCLPPAAPRPDAAAARSKASRLRRAPRRPAPGRQPQRSLHRPARRHIAPRPPVRPQRATPSPPSTTR